MADKCPTCGAAATDHRSASQMFWCGSYFESGVLNESKKCLRRQLAALEAKNAALNIALFHVENGSKHPDERIRKLVEAAEAAKETENGQ